MRAILVPHSATADRVSVWVGAADTRAAPRNLTLRLLPDGREIPLPDDGWWSVTAGGALPPDRRRLFMQVVAVPGLRQRQRYRIEAGDGAAASFSTLPPALPGAGESPFNILLSSCFYRGNDREGLIGRAVARLPAEFRPDLKFLCGDQVYLDIASFGGIPSVLLPSDDRRLAENLLGNYLGNWGQTDGFQELLASGSGWMTADDHEFWNNFPNPTPLVLNTLTRGGRERYARVAGALFAEFQCEEPSLAGRARQFSVGGLSFFVADTRVKRESGDGRFMAEEDFTRLETWLRTLERPGVLVIGQPVFQEPANFVSRRLADRHLSNYRQYEPLARALSRAPRSVLILTGDVHFGRVAVCELSPGTRGPRLAEVIASPSSLVHRLSGGKAYDAPEKFPPEPIAGVARRETRTWYTTAEEHFATLRFTEKGESVLVETTYWFPKRAGNQAERAPLVELW